MAAQKPLVIISGQIQQLPTGDTLDAVASEVEVITRTNANAGALVIGTPVYPSAAGSVDKANASAAASSRVLGFITDTSIATGGTAHVQAEGVLTATTTQWDAITGQTGGLTSGGVYFLDSTAGKITPTALSASGKYNINVGLALSTTELDINIDLMGVLFA